MKKALKIAGITVGVILILLLVLPFAFQGKIEKIVKQEGNKMLNAQFDFSALNISLLRNFPSASVTLEDFYLKGTGAFENDTLIQAGELTFQDYHREHQSKGYRIRGRQAQLGRDEGFRRRRYRSRNFCRKFTFPNQAEKAVCQRLVCELR